MKQRIIHFEKSVKWCISLLICTMCFPVMAQVPAFPGAEGFGAMTTGGRGGKVIQVTNLNDSGTGSLRAAVQSTGTRTVVFRVSGTIHLNSPLEIDKDNITIAGQTAPGDGICIKNYPLHVSANNVIIRFIRARHGDLLGSQDDAMNGRNQENIIIDHCSMSWSVDECASFYDNKNFTLQYCILSESLYHSVHDKGNHGYGGIWGGQGATFHHNLLAHHTSRNPRFNGSRYSGEPALEMVDHRNNVIFNWGFNSCYGGEAGNYNMVANYYKSGPATSSSVKDRIMDPDANDNGYGFYHISGNVTQGYPATTEDNWRGVDGISDEVKEQIRLDEPLDAPALTPHTAYEAFEYVLNHSGASLPKRDALDTRIVHETLTGTAQYGGNYGTAAGIIDSQQTVGGWVTLESTTPPEDSDNDGMPDAWEDNMGLDKNNPDDRNGDITGNGYTNLEDYLNGLVEEYEYLLRPVELAVDTVMEHKVTLAWKDISDNETGFVIERKEGESWNEIAITPANDTNYTDESISSNGLYYYRLKSVNDAMESWYTDSVSVNLTVGIDPSRAGLHGFKVFPNPVSGEARLYFSLTEKTFVDLSVLELSGRHLMQLEKIVLPSGEHQLIFDASRLEAGMYFIRLKAGDRISLKKIIKSK